MERGNLFEGLIVVSREWVCIHANEVALRDAPHGTELIGRRMTDVFPGVESTASFAVLGHVMRDRVPARFEQLCANGHGEPRWREIRVEPVREGICIHTVDVHARHEEAERHASCERASAEERGELERALRSRAALDQPGEEAATFAREVLSPLADACGALRTFGERLDPQGAEHHIVALVAARLEALSALVSGVLDHGR